jgi:hypothetical protein
MNSSFQTALNQLRVHWFFLVGGAIIAGDLTIVSARGWSLSSPSPLFIEAALLFDFAVIVPLLYAWCYRTKGKAAIIRALGLSCLAIWATGYVVPPEHHHVLNSVAWLRYVGMVVLTLLEIKLLIVFYRAVFSNEKAIETAANKLAADAGMPPWVARLVAFEAKFWRKVLGLLKRITGRKNQD